MEMDCNKLAKFFGFIKLAPILLIDTFNTFFTHGNKLKRVINKMPA